MPATRQRVKLVDQNKNLLLRKLRKNNIKTLKTDSNSNVSVTSVKLRKQFVATSNNSGQLVLTAGSNEVFSAKSNTDYIISILDDDGASGVTEGDLINTDANDTSFTGTGTNQLTITNTARLNAAGIKCKVTTTVTRTQASEIAKAPQLAAAMVVDNHGIAGGKAFGTSVHHKEISLGVADVYKLWGVFDSEDTSTEAVLPSMTTTSEIGSFTRGEIITGGTSGARAVVIPGTNTNFIVINNKSFAILIIQPR